MYAQLSEPPPPVTTRRPDLTRAVDTVFARALAKAPADRYPNCREFSDALREAFGIRPYDSGPNVAPSGEHPHTQVVRPSDGGQGAGAAGGYQGGSYPGAGQQGGGFQGAGQQGAGQPGGYRGAGQQGGYQGAGYSPGGGYAGGGYPSGPGGQGTYGGPGQQGQGQPGQGQGAGGPGMPSGPPVGAGAGGYGGAETQVAGGGRQTSPDLTAAHWQGPGGGGYGDYSTGGGGGGGRPWWRSPVALVAVLVVLIGGGAAAYFVANGKGGGTTGGGGPPPHVTSLTAPGCSDATASSKQLPVTTGAAAVPSGNGNPFGVAASKDGKAVFVTTDKALYIYQVGSGGTLTARGWSYPIGGSPSGGVATNVILTNDGKYLLVAADNGIQVLDAIGAENGASSINKGVLAVPGQSKDHRSITVAVTPDDKFVFASLQFADQVGVFNLAQFLSTGDPSSAYIGSLNVGTQPVGLTVSPDGKTLYATDFVENNPVPGKLTVIDVAKATTKGQQNGAIIATAHAGCQPARVAVTSDGKTVWVTSRRSNYVLGYSASTLLTKPKKALIAKVKVGQWPIGIQLVNSGSRLVISDNNGNDSSPTSTSKAHNLAVVDPGAALNGKPALIGYIPSGVTPRDMAVSPDGKYLYVVNRDSAQVQVVKLRTLP